MNADWFPDPSGRFNQRFFDGSGWTEHVVGANGSTVADPLTGAFPPPPPLTATPPPPPPFHHASTGTAPHASGPRTTSWVGVGIAGVGLLLAALSLYALDWVDGTSIGDLRDGLPDTLPDGLPLADVLSLNYLRWGGLLLLLGVIAALLAVGVAVSRRDGDGARLLGAAVAGTAAALHTITVVRLFRAPGADPAVGAWLGTIGFLAVAVGLAIAAPKDRTSS